MLNIFAFLYYLDLQNNHLIIGVVFFTEFHSRDIGKGRYH